MSNPLKKTMVFLGLAEEDFDDAISNETQEQPKQHRVETPVESKPAVREAEVTPLRRVTPVTPANAGSMNEIMTMHPTEYRDAQTIAESFRDGLPVILNLSRMNEADAKRLIDFSSGLVMGLGGKIERVTSKVFLLSPEHILVSGARQDVQSEPESGSFFVAAQQ